MEIHRRSPRAEQLRAWVEEHCPRLYDRAKVLHVTWQDRTYRRPIAARVAELAAVAPAPLFTEVEIETVNRCNGACSFCPVNRDADPRPLARMTEPLFRSILAQLAALDYRGTLSLYSNNEPLLDTRIAEWCRLARAALPGAQLSLFTNGSLLTVDRFRELIDSLDHLRINNYDDRLQLTPPVRELTAWLEERPDLGRKVSVFVQRQQVVRYSRGGQAPNRLPLPRAMRSSCVLPFTQLVVRPDGGVSLCCQDALGRHTLGDLTRQSLLEVWHGDACRQVRERITAGRDRLELCRRCDFFTC